MEILPSIYEFSDYRQYLRAYYEYRKSSPQGYSYKKFAREAGLKSDNYLSFIIDGKRNLTVHNIHQVARAMKLGANELAYFEALVLLGQAQGQAEKEFYEKRLASMKSANPVASKILDRKFVDHELTPKLMLALSLPRVEKTIKGLSVFLGANESVITAIVEKLLSKGVLTKQEKDARLSVAQDQLVVSNTLPDRQQKLFLKRQIQATLQNFERLYDRNGKFLTHHFTAANDFDGKDAMLSFVSELTKKADEDPPEKIYQINIQFLPLT